MWFMVKLVDFFRKSLLEENGLIKLVLHLLYIYDYNYIRWQMYSKYIMIRDMYIFVGKYTNVEYLFVLNKTRTYIYNYLTLINHQFSPKDFFF
jgi:hypothetical protein